jgi:aryl sulfotransferase
VPGQFVRYLTEMEDSGRWAGFPFRAGDIVISTRTRTGTTWMQMICALLIFQTPELPGPLGRLSPWLDRVIYSRDALYSRLEGQQHRRFIKTHTPLEGIPLDSRATYIVTARHPLDTAVSLWHHYGNLDTARQRQLAGQREPAEPGKPREPLREWLLDWIGQDTDPRAALDSLPGILHHLSDAWARRGEPNVLLVHYDDLLADLEGQMRRVAAQLGITIPHQSWPGLIEAATFERMRAGGEQITGASSILKDSGAFFRRGRSGAAREILTSREICRYHARAAQLAPVDLLTWLHAPHPMTQK